MFSGFQPVFSYELSTGTPGWEEILSAYNEFASEHNGVPLFNQSHLLAREQVTQAFGDRLAMFEKHRHRFDPAERLLNDYFHEFLRNLEKDAPKMIPLPTHSLH